MRVLAIIIDRHRIIATSLYVARMYLHMIPMSQRKQDILRALVEEYIHSATPVASETLVRKYGLNYSSATVRHELAGLEEAHLIPAPYLGRSRPYRPGLPLLRRTSHAGIDAFAQRAASDSPPVLPGAG